MGGGGIPRDSPLESEEILKKIRESNSETSRNNYESYVNTLIDKKLSLYNNRDQEAFERHINTIKKALGKEIDGTITISYGGSIEKKTFIDGFSDIDTLVILNKSELLDKSPKDVLNYFYRMLKSRFPNTEIAKGSLAVTVSFSDIDVQLLPSIKYQKGIRIADDDSPNNWSKIIMPSVFARALRVLDQRLFGRLVPAIKIMKSIIARFPESAQLKGYHVEALAIEVFTQRAKDPNKPLVKDIIKKFFSEAPSLVANPIHDITGQTTYVDEYLGGKKNIRRKIVSDALDRVSRRIEFADTGLLKDYWDEIL